MAPQPFSCKYSPNLPELLGQLHCSLAISTFQAGKVTFISRKNKEELVQLPRHFTKAMGIAVKDRKMAVATQDEVVILVNEPGLAENYPNQPNTYDGLYLPQATYYTGSVDIHDLHFGNNALWAVNTSFSCLCTIDDNYSFIPQWQPSFISELASEDRCHLNGIAMHDGKPAFATALGKTNTPNGWREHLPNGGIIMDVTANKIVAENLPMPHSPRLYNGNLYLLLSATGQLIKMDPDTGRYSIVKNLEGFTRGLAIYEDYAFIGLSKLRKNASTFSDLPIASKANHSGIAIMHLPTEAIVARLDYETSVDEIYDVHVIPGYLRPGILNTSNETFRLGLTTPDNTYWGKPPQ